MGERSGRVIARIILWFNLLAGCLVVLGQSGTVQNQDSLQMERLILQSDDQRDKGQLSASIADATAALRIAVEKSFGKKESVILVKLARLYRRQNDFETSLKYYLRSASLLEKISANGTLTELYIEIAGYYNDNGAFEKSIDYFVKAYDADSSDVTNRIELLERIGQEYYFLKDYGQALRFYEKLNNQLEREKDENFQIRTWYNLSKIHQKLSHYDKSLEFNLRIKDYHQKKNNGPDASIAWNNIGYDYVHLKRYPEAIQAFKKSLQLEQDHGNDQKEVSKLYVNLGICYQNTGDSPTAIKNLLSALEIQQKGGNAQKTGEIQDVIAMVYFYIEDYYNASQFSQNSIESAKKSGDMELLHKCYNTYSKILKAGNDYIKALEYYELHLQIRDSLLLEQKMKEQEVARNRFTIERTEKETKLTIASEEMKDLAMKKMKIEAEKRKKEIELLRSEKELQDSEKKRMSQELALADERHKNELIERENALIAQEKKSLEQEKAIQDLTIKQKEIEEKKREQEMALLEIEKEKEQAAKKMTMWMLVLAGIILVLILMSLISSRKKNQRLARQKREIEEKNSDLEIKSEKIVAQKNVIEEKNKSISDSIQYAKRIQDALLMSADEWDLIGVERFVLFRPKDVVSGDFYWAYHLEKENTYIWLAADCTGHGVPGAFMSIQYIKMIYTINRYISIL